MNEKKTSVIIIMTGLILWILYLSDAEMSRYGIYTIFSYSTHEIMSVIPFLGIIITVVWLLSLISKMIKEKNIKQHILLITILLVLCISQTIYIYNRSQTVTTSFVTTIDGIDPDHMEIITHNDGNDLRLYCPQIVLDALKTDGTEYGITYEWNKKNPGHGKLCIVQSINYQ